MHVNDNGGDVSEDVGKDLIKKVESFCDVYANSIVSRTFVTAIPWVGGPIDVALSGDAGRRWQSRWNEFFKMLNDRCQKLDKNKIDNDFLESDEFVSLLMGILESLRKTHEKEKMARFANILLRSSEKNHSGDYYKERFIKLVDETTEVHILILRQFNIEVQHVGQREGVCYSTCLWGYGTGSWAARNASL